ncbi:MAG: hypothetical protein AMS27_13335 [Bacteroides sp. SM23_62_1]|nr:MAG: hypothetical protein AMS27_13335 [Bacteroides sp. SM23_62_1]
MFIIHCQKDNDDKNNITVTDMDGNVYHTVTIGTQVWMVENLKTTKYNDGTAIPLVTNETTWSNLTTPGYCWLNNDSLTYKNPYGALYNWYVVNSNKLCPTNWHVPTEGEWTTLMNYLGGSDIAGGKLKEAGTIHWLTPNTGATNETGFTALPGSGRSYTGQFGLLNKFGNWWSSTEENEYAFAVGVNFDDSHLGSFFIIKKSGSSVRCVKD